MKLIVILFLVLGIAMAANPDEMLTYHDSPGIVQLHNVDPSSSKSIADTNVPLNVFVPWDLPNIGHYASWAEKVVQTNSTEDGLDSWAATEESLSEDVGDGTNATAINSSATSRTGIASSVASAFSSL